MRALALAVALAVALPWAAGCPSGPRGEGGAGSSNPVLEIRCDVADAVVWVDDRMIGEVGEAPGGYRLRPGEHRIEIRHERYHTRYLELTLRQGEVCALDVTLAEILD